MIHGLSALDEREPKVSQRMCAHAPGRRNRNRADIVVGCCIALLIVIASAPRAAEAQAQQIESDTAQKIKDPAPMPGAEAALRHQFEAFKQGQPDLNVMTDDLATATRPQIPNITRQLERSGALQTLSFRGVGFSGFDIYEAKFEHGLVICRILMTSDNKISGLRFEWGP